MYTYPPPAPPVNGEERVNEWDRGAHAHAWEYLSLSIYVCIYIYIYIEKQILWDSATQTAKNFVRPEWFLYEPRVQRTPRGCFPYAAFWVGGQILL